MTAVIVGDADIGDDEAVWASSRHHHSDSLAVRVHADPPPVTGAWVAQQLLVILLVGILFDRGAGDVRLAVPVECAGQDPGQQGYGVLIIADLAEGQPARWLGQGCSDGPAIAESFDEEFSAGTFNHLHTLSDPSSCHGIFSPADRDRLERKLWRGRVCGQHRVHCGPQEPRGYVDQIGVV
ncbi:hypothetical protein FH608_034380 [Nonomuraea phyllanthi]|uniref:Uncharacterized protein n=1 Tax=Nonomuraea phyllanthi TaxID=2219224 RepID=A0A5C4VZD4_9ACTN|nr:hypothetical protein FH608_034380 [Nonomuraea phyllanthi]